MAGASAASGQGGGGLGQGFHLLGAYWSGSEVLVDAINPETGQGTYVGSLGPLMGWTGALFLNGDGTLAHAMAATTDLENLVTLDLATGITVGVSTEPVDALAGVHEDGRVIGIRWDGNAEVVSLIDPATGVSTAAGSLSDLHWWTSQAAYDRSHHVVYALGQNASQATWFLYGLSLDSGVTQALELPESQPGFLAGADASGRVLEITLDQSLAHVVADDSTNGVKELGSIAGVPGLYQIGGVAFDGTSKVYVGSPPQLFSFDVVTKASHTSMISQQYTLARR